MSYLRLSLYLFVLYSVGTQAAPNPLDSLNINLNIEDTASKAKESMAMDSGADNNDYSADDNGDDYTFGPIIETIGKAIECLAGNSKGGASPAMQPVQPKAGTGEDYTLNHIPDWLLDLIEDKIKFIKCLKSGGGGATDPHDLPMGGAKETGADYQDVFGCFGTKDQVETMTGYKKISELQLGDFIRTSSGGTNTHFTEFVGWLERQTSSPVRMVEILTTKKNPTLTLTANHIVFTSDSTKYANDLLPGDSLLYWNGTHTVDKIVAEVRQTLESGWWAPLTMDGTLFVNGYLASSYASFPHEVSDMAFSPVKAAPTILLDDQESQDKDGVRSVVKLMKIIGETFGMRRTKAEYRNAQSLLVKRSFQLDLFTAKNEL